MSKWCDWLQTIRTSLLDLREKAYERSGLGSSYLFRIDESWAVDATRQVSHLHDLQNTNSALPPQRLSLSKAIMAYPCMHESFWTLSHFAGIALPLRPNACCCCDLHPFL